LFCAGLGLGVGAKLDARLGAGLGLGLGLDAGLGLDVIFHTLGPDADGGKFSKYRTNELLSKIFTIWMFNTYLKKKMIPNNA